MAAYKWNGKRSEFITWYVHKDYKSFFDALEYNSKNIVRLVIAERMEELLNSLKHGFLVLGSLKEKIIADDIEKKAIFEIGRVYGVMQLSKYLYREKERNMQVSEQINLSYQIKHLNEIIILLNKEFQLTHSQLCDKLDMQPSALTECMKRILPTGLVDCKRIGQFKLYSLSPDGKRYARLTIYKKGLQLAGIKSTKTPLSDAISGINYTLIDGGCISDNFTLKKPRIGTIDFNNTSGSQVRPLNEKYTSVLYSTNGDDIYKVLFEYDENYNSSLKKNWEDTAERSFSL